MNRWIIIVLYNLAGMLGFFFVFNIRDNEKYNNIIFTKQLSIGGSQKNNYKYVKFISIVQIKNYL